MVVWVGPVLGGDSVSSFLSLFCLGTIGCIRLRLLYLFLVTFLAHVESNFSNCGRVLVINS
jgi:hypothetical protein